MISTNSFRLSKLGFETCKEFMLAKHLKLLNLNKTTNNYYI